MFDNTIISVQITVITAFKTQIPPNDNVDILLLYLIFNLQLMHYFKKYMLEKQLVYFFLNISAYADRAGHVIGEIRLMRFKVTIE